MGTFEFYYDIKDKMNTFNNHVKKVNLYIIALNSIFIIIVCYVLYFTSRNKLRNIQYQKELEHLKDILNETNAYIYTKDLDGHYTFANKMVVDLFNISLEDLRGKDDTFFFDLEISRELRENDNLVIKEEKAIKKEEALVLKKQLKLKYIGVLKNLYMIKMELL